MLKAFLQIKFIRFSSWCGLWQPS